MIKVGTLFAGRYGVIQKIGTGGMAEVFKAQDVVENRVVALKVMKDSLATDEACVRRFEAEGKQAAELRHENVVTVYDVGVSAGTHYIVMEYVSGIVLKEYIRKKGKLSARETMAISAQIACGLRAAHAHHIVHRDIKPQNIILSKDGKVKITDFGIARSIGEEAKNGKFTVGSVYYISPEQAKGESCDERSDIYSLGVVMYEMITGVVPFDKETTNAVALAHMNESMKAPSEINPDCPRALEQIIFRSTQKSSARRYTNCTELLQDLKIAVSSPDYDFEQKEKAALLKNKTMVFAKNGAGISSGAAAASSHAHEANARTSSSYGVSSRSSSGASEAEEEEDEREALAGVRRGRGGSGKNGFDRFLAVSGVILGILMIFLIIYIIMSLSGCLQRKITPGDRETTTREGGTSEPTTEEPIEISTKAPDDFDPATDAKVPNLIGLPIMDAVKALSDAGLDYKLSQRTEYSDEYELGTVIVQSYPEGTVVPKGSTIVVVISAGSDKFFIDPKYVGGPLSAFKDDSSRLSEAIQFEYVKVTSDTVPANVIISIDPVNVTVQSGDHVVITYSGGPNYATVPDLKGRTREEAARILEEAGLVLGAVSEEYSDEVAKDLIMKQEHPQGNRLKNGSTVGVTVSLGRKTAMIPEDLVVNADGSRNTYGTVKARLQELGYVVRHEEQYDAQYGQHDSEDKAYVLSVDPAPGTEYAAGREVTVVTATDSQILEDYSGMVYQEVAALLAGDPYGFAVEPVYVMAKEPGQEGRIEKQNPAAGTAWEKGMYITLTVYTEGMIDMRGMTAQDAKSFIEEKGWVYKQVTGPYVDDATAGTVLSTDPKGGTFPESGATITVTVAAGKEEPTTEPPTDEPTEPPTETPTDPPTETPTDPPSETTTEAPTDTPTEPSVEPVTETAPEAPTDAETTASETLGQADSETQPPAAP